MRLLARGLLGAMVVILAVAPATSARDLVEVFRFGGRGCAEVGFGGPLTAERARLFLPPGYEPTNVLGAPGFGQLTAGILSCEEFNVDGVEEGPASIAHARIAVSSPDGSPGGHTYVLWHLSTSAAHRAGMDRAGIPGCPDSERASRTWS